MINRHHIAVLSTMICLAFAGGLSFELTFPEHFPEPIYSFSNNPITSEKITLGRALFYDTNLSRDSTVSCASCHSPYNSFAHTDHDLSHGIDNQIGRRNAPALFNLAWQKDFMWDGAINHLDVQALAPLTHSKEMDTDLTSVLKYLNGTRLYNDLFQAAFGDSLATSESLLKALSSFQLSLISANAKYDLVVKGDTTFSEQEEKGYLLFKSNCNNCHVEPLFSSYKFKNNGLPIDSTLMDYGRGEITHLAKDSLRFKIPSLRNLSYSYPYMHDGRFNKLHEVLNHYTSNHKNTSLDREETIDQINLTSKEKADLTAFLLTLNDKTFIFDPTSKYPRHIFLNKLQNANLQVTPD